MEWFSGPPEGRGTSGNRVVERLATSNRPDNDVPYYAFSSSEAKKRG